LSARGWTRLGAACAQLLLPSLLALAPSALQSAPPASQTRASSKFTCRLVPQPASLQWL